jgi:ribosomal protein S18 acetylase RimI-like enzyme
VSADARIATPNDARAIAEIHVASWQGGYRGQLPDSYLKSLSVDARETRWAQSLRDGASVLLAEHAAKPLGFVSYGPSRDDDAPETGGEIYGLYVHPHAWSTGMGEQLHDGALAALTAEGTTVVTLWVLTSNDRARRFYSRHGWQQDGVTKVVELDGVTLSELRYKRTLKLESVPTSL